MPDLRIVGEALTAETLAAYAGVSIAFRVESFFRLDPISNGLSGLRTMEVPVTPYTKDYDLDQGEGPLSWLTHGWDVSGWTLLSAFDGDQRVGGATVALAVDGVDFLRGQPDTAALWDIRVAEDARRHRVGSALFQAAAAWAKSKGCRRIKIETQDVNVGACFFYARMGCELGGFNRHVYPSHPDEVQLIWQYELT